MPEASLDLLREAIAQRAGAVISLPVGGGLRHFKTRFVGEENDAFLVEPVAAELPELERVIAEVREAVLALGAPAPSGGAG